jgi:hypothetical protein
MRDRKYIKRFNESGNFKDTATQYYQNNIDSTNIPRDWYELELIEMLSEFKNTHNTTASEFYQNSIDDSNIPRDKYEYEIIDFIDNWWNT